VKIWENFQLTGRKGLKLKEKSACTLCVQTNLENSTAFAVKWLVTYKFNKIIKGEL
jgi:hypothetical protein